MFSAHLTVLRFITTVWAKTSKIPNLHEFHAEVSEIVFSAILIILRLFHNFISSNSKNLMSPCVWCTSITNRVLSSNNRFTALLQLHKQKLQRCHISLSSVHKYDKSCSQLIWPFYCLLQLYEVKLKKSHISISSVHKYHKSCVLNSFLTFSGFLHLYEVKLQKSYISVSSVHKYQKSCSQVTWPFYIFLQLYEQNLQKSHISVGSVHKYQKFYSQLTWPFYGLLQLYEVKLQKSYFSVSSVEGCNK